MSFSVSEPGQVRKPSAAPIKRSLTPIRQITRLSVLMPVYNERQTVEAVVQRVLDAPRVELDLELVIVDDGSTDGSWEVIESLAEREPRVEAVRHPRNRGKGAAIRTAIDRMSGGVALVQDADLEYDPAEYPKLLAPILDGRADAVFGTRFTGTPRRVQHFWHTLANQAVTLFCNMVNNLNLTDMETCYKVVRADVLKNLVLESDTFTIEPELSTRLAQWGARIYEVPISYSGRSYDEGKKIGAVDALKACWAILKYGLFSTRFTYDPAFYALAAVAKARRYNRMIFRKVRPYLGARLLEANAGLGTMSRLFMQRERVMLAENEPLFVARLRDRFAHLANVEVCELDSARAEDFEPLAEQRLDSIFCANVLEHVEDDAGVLRNFLRILQPGGHCAVVVPAEPSLFTARDKELGHLRRYRRRELEEKLERAGFEVVHCEQFNKLGTLGWFVAGKILRRRISPAQMIWFDRLLWLARLVEYTPFLPGLSLLAVGQKPGRR